MLGAHQDAVVGEEVLRRLAPELPGAALAMGRLVDRERARRAEARAAWQRRVARARAARQGARRMTLVVVRHGSAGDRDEWDDDDRLRPLDKKGRKQAARLVDVLAGSRIDASSAARTCAASRPSSRSRGRAGSRSRRSWSWPSTSSRDGPPSSPRCSSDHAVACVHGGIERALGLDLRFRRAPSGASWTRSSGPRSWSEGCYAARRVASRRAAAPSRRPPAPSWNGVPRHRVSSREDDRAGRERRRARLVDRERAREVARRLRDDRSQHAGRASPRPGAGRRSSRASAHCRRRRAPCSTSGGSSGASRPATSASASASCSGVGGSSRSIGAVSRSEPRSTDSDQNDPRSRSPTVISVEPPPTSHTATGPSPDRPSSRSRPRRRARPPPSPTARGRSGRSSGRSWPPAGRRSSPAARAR